MLGTLVQHSYHVAATVLLLVLTASGFVTLITVPSRADSASPSTLLHDDFTHDTNLNQSLWQVNGPVGSVFGPDDAGITLIPLSPRFSSAGMKIAQANQSEVVGTIQSISSFTPPFTATAVVEGTVSNGHTFGFAIASTNASNGVVVYGNLNPTNCSHEGNCGDPTICGTPANSAVPPNQCYYGIDVKAGKGGGSWASAAKLYLTPSVNVSYTLQISVDASGSAQYSVSQGGQVLGQSTAQVGTGPFYIIMEQGEGAPVASPGPNQAYWMSVSLTPTVASSSTTSTASTSIGPTPTSPGIPTSYWIIIAIIIVLFLILLLLYARRRGLTVTVVDSQTRSPIPEAIVTADGPKNLSDTTGKDGKAVFGDVKKGAYSIKAVAKGYNPSIPVTISVKGKTDYAVKLDRTPPSAAEGAGSQAPPEAAATQAVPQAPTPVVTQAAEPVPQPSAQQETAEFEGFGGERIREIIRAFQEKGAISPETAMTAKELGLSRIFVRIMQRRRGRTRIFMEVNGKYYLNQKALEEMK